MKKYYHSVSVLFACALLSAFFFASCYSTPTRDRGSLSDAMDGARDDSDDRSVPSKPRFPYDDPYDDPYDTPLFPVWPSTPVRTPDEPYSPPAESAPHESEPAGEVVPIETEMAFGLRYGISPFVSGDATRIDDFTFILGFVGEPAELLFTLSTKLVEPCLDSELYLSTADTLTMFSLGAEFRRVPFSSRTFFSPWYGFGAEAFLMGWEFRNPLKAGSDTISSDMIGGLTLYPSLGVYLARNDFVSVSLFALPAVSFFREVTAEGFNNDFFLPMLSCQAGLEVMIR